MPVMPRTRVFISYCNEDWQWLDRLCKHLAVLERKNLIDVWSDRRIGAGERWEDEIEKALTGAKIAVLILTPGFMASRYIWEREITHIQRHQAAGMLVLPIRAEPCAWDLESLLAQIEARPKGDFPLSAYSSVEIDSELTAFAYEMYARLTDGSTHAWEQQVIANIRLKERRAGQTIGIGSGLMHGAHGQPDAGVFVMRSLPREWLGEYPPNTRFSLTITRVLGSDFEGILDYIEHDTKTRITGFATGHPTAVMESAYWNQLNVPNSQAAICFAEHEYLLQGRTTVDFGGVYRGLFRDDILVGGWYRGGNLVGHFSFRTRVRS
jgi:TIR domain